MSTTIKITPAFIICLIFIVSACSYLHTIPSTTFTDPFQYCMAVGTIDSFDSRYTGLIMPESLVKEIISKGIVSADAPPEFQDNAIWRCMDNHVWVCIFGANIPCDKKADTSTSPSPEIKDYCKSNPNSDFLPAYVTGRLTVYEWKCASGKPEIGRQVLQVDSQGFPSNYWYQLSKK
jgi:hypothetical protein